MLALNGIFILVTKHGLEYPMFYQRLYNLLSADAFQVLLPAARQTCTGAKYSAFSAAVQDMQKYVNSMEPLTTS